MDLTASSVMTADVKTVPPDMPVPDLEERLHDDRISGYPVVEKGRVVGVVSRADIVRHMDLERSIIEIAADYYGKNALPPDEVWIAETTGRQMDELLVRDIMSPHLIHVGSNDRLHRVAELMTTERVHRVLVTQGSKLLGVITAFDFVKLYSEDRISPSQQPFAGTPDF